MVYVSIMMVYAVFRPVAMSSARSQTARKTSFSSPTSGMRLIATFCYCVNSDSTREKSENNTNDDYVKTDLTWAGGGGWRIGYKWTQSNLPLLKKSCQQNPTKKGGLV